MADRVSLYHARSGFVFAAAGMDSSNLGMKVGDRRPDLLILDDIGYIQQDRDEMEVLFTLLAERYERRSVALTSNLVFSQWDRIFKDPMTTAAAIDRVVHHSVILELTGPSFRAEAAKTRIQNEGKSTTA